MTEENEILSENDINSLLKGLEEPETDTDTDEDEDTDTEYPDMVNHPPHYKKHKSGIECIQISEGFNFCLGNAIKYIWRSDHKNGIEDLQKAVWYINREIQRRKQ